MKLRRSKLPPAYTKPKLIPISMPALIGMLSVRIALALPSVAAAASPWKTPSASSRLLYTGTIARGLSLWPSWWAGLMFASAKASRNGCWRGSSSAWHGHRQREFHDLALSMKRAQRWRLL